MTNPLISIIIPTLNEEKYCEPLLQQLRSIQISHEIIVVDGGSEDQTKEIASQYADYIIETSKGRGLQLAEGFQISKGSYLLFLHADVQFQMPTFLFLEDLIRHKVALASFRINFDMNHWFLKLNAFFTRFSASCFYFGDQGLWISRELYLTSGGFDSRLDILEDQEFYNRAKRKSTAMKLRNYLIVSDRKYRKRGVFKLQFFYYRIWLMYFLGMGSQRIQEVYRSYFAS